MLLEHIYRDDNPYFWAWSKLLTLGLSPFTILQ